MKTRVGFLMVVFFMSISMLAGQESSGRNNLVIHGTVQVIGPNGATNGHNAPAALVVTAGRGGDGGIVNVNGGTGGGIQLTAGAGGGSSQDAGTGGSIALIAGNGGVSSEVGGSGGSIVLQPGATNCGVLCGVSGNVILAVPSGGAVGVGTQSPSNTLEVVAGGTTLADAWTVRSSRRFKTNIQPLVGALAKVQRLQGVSYERKSDGQHEIGVVAEDVALVVPEVVSRDPKTNEVQGVDYSRLAALLIEAVKSQQDEIRELKAQIARLTNDSAGQ